MCLEAQAVTVFEGLKRMSRLGEAVQAAEADRV